MHIHKYIRVLNEENQSHRAKHFTEDALNYVFENKIKINHKYHVPFIIFFFLQI